MPRGRFRRLGLLTCLAIAIFACASASAVAKPGDLLIADPSSDPSGDAAIFRLDPSTGVVTTVAMGAPLENAFSLDFDAAGKLLVTDPGTPDEVFRVDPSTGVITTVATGAPFGDVLGVAVGPNGHAFVTDDTVAPKGAIFDIDPATGAKSTLTDGSPFGDDPQGIDVNPQGQLFVADYDSASIYRVDPSGAKTPIVSGPPLIEPNLISLDPAGQLIVPDGDGHAVHRVDPATGAVTTIHAGAPFDFPFAAATTETGDIIVVDESAGPGGNGAIFRITPDGAVTTLASGQPLGEPLDVAIEPPTCRGKVATIVGTTGPDTLTGGPFADVIAALGGKDRVQGAAGNDTVCAGPGKDRVSGGSGSDGLFGEAGKDNLSGGKGKDKCVGGKATDKGKSCEKGKL